MSSTTAPPREPETEQEDGGQEPEPGEPETGEPETGEPETGEPDGEPEAAASKRKRGPTRRQRERAAEEAGALEQARALDAVMAAFEADLQRLFELEEPLEPVPMPGVIGYALPGAFDQRAHDAFTRCATCNGHGVVLTGSLRAGHETTECPDRRCAGRGYWARRGVAEEAPPADGPAALEQAAADQGADEWGDAPPWMGDPTLRPATG